MVRQRLLRRRVGGRLQGAVVSPHLGLIRIAPNLDHQNSVAEGVDDGAAIVQSGGGYSGMISKDLARRTHHTTGAE